VKKLVLFLLVLFLFSACAHFMPQVQWDKLAFHQVEIDEEIYYFSYPITAAVFENSLTFDNCKIEFGKKGKIENEYRYKLKPGADKYEAWYDSNDLLVIYRTTVDGFSFLSEDFGYGVSHCVNLMNFLADSFSDSPVYINDRFEFSVELPESYEAEYLNDDAGIILKKDMIVEVEDEDELGRYTAEIVLLPFENLKGYKGLNDFVSTEYGGYNLEYVAYNDVAGFYVDEGAGMEAVKHFYTMRSNDDFIFEAYLKLPSEYYDVHRDEFEKMVKSLDLF